MNERRVGAYMEAKNGPRFPNSSSIVPKSQCGGDWGFLQKMASEFVDSSIARVESSIDASPTAIANIAHTIKTTAEVLSMGEVAESAYDVELAVFKSLTEVDILSVQSILLEKLLGLQIALSLHFSEETISSVQGYFDKISIDGDKVIPHRRRGSSVDSDAVIPPSVKFRRIVVVCDDPTLKNIIERWVAPFVSSEGGEAEIFVHSPTHPFVEEERRHAFTVIVGDLDDLTHARVHGMLFGWCDTVRSPPCPEEIMRRIVGLCRI